MKRRDDRQRSSTSAWRRLRGALVTGLGCVCSAGVVAQPAPPAPQPSKPAATPAETPTKTPEEPAPPDTKAPPAKTAPPPTREDSPDAPMTTQADIERRWVTATNAFVYQDFDTAIPAIRSLLYPAVLVDRARERKLREYLGAAHWWQGNNQGWSDAFASLLANFPDATLDPTFYPPQMIADLERRRAELIALGVLDDPDGKGGPRRLVADRPPLVLAFVPFGVGQFANRQPVKGGLFLATEAGLALASTWLYLGNRDRGLRGERSQPHHIAQLSTGSAFWALAVLGVIDAVVFRPEAIGQPR